MKNGSKENGSVIYSEKAGFIELMVGKVLYILSDGRTPKGICPLSWRQSPDCKELVRAGGKLASKRLCRGLPGDPVVKNLPANAGEMGSIPGPGRSHMLRGS